MPWPGSDYTKPLDLCPSRSFSLKEGDLVYSVIQQDPWVTKECHCPQRQALPKAKQPEDEAFDEDSYISGFWTIWAPLSFILPASNCPQIKETSKHALLEEAHTRFTKQLYLGRAVNQRHVQSQRTLSSLSEAVIGSAWCIHRRSGVGGVIISSVQVRNFS